MVAVGGRVETCSGLFLGGVTPEVVEESAGSQLRLITQGATPKGEVFRR